MPYTDSVNVLLERGRDASLVNPDAHVYATPPIVRFVDDKPMVYRVDFRANTQTNAKTGYVRAVSRQEVRVRTMPAGVAWEYLDDDTWHAFDSLVQGVISTAFDAYRANRTGSVVDVAVPGRPEVYTLDFMRGTQRNSVSRREREIRRR